MAKKETPPRTAKAPGIDGTKQKNEITESDYLLLKQHLYGATGINRM